MFLKDTFLVDTVCIILKFLAFLSLAYLQLIYFFALFQRSSRLSLEFTHLLAELFILFIEVVFSVDLSFLECLQSSLSDIDRLLIPCCNFLPHFFFDLSDSLKLFLFLFH